MKKHRVRGLSLIEILVVLAIVALVSGVIAFAVMPELERARIKTTAQSARALREAAMRWRMDRGDECPTVERLVADQAIDEASRTKDAWDKPFAIACEDGRIRVASAGPDKRENTPDDIRVP